jgi:hypothetical protein
MRLKLTTGIELATQQFLYRQFPLIPSALLPAETTVDDIAVR